MKYLSNQKNDCILQTNSFGLVNCHIFRPNGRNVYSLRLTVNFDQFGDTGGDVESNKNINDGY